MTWALHSHSSYVSRTSHGFDGTNGTHDFTTTGKAQSINENSLIAQRDLFRPYMRRPASPPSDPFAESAPPPGADPGEWLRVVGLPAWGGAIYAAAAFALVALLFYGLTPVLKARPMRVGSIEAERMA